MIKTFVFALFATAISSPVSAECMCILKYRALDIPRIIESKDLSRQLKLWDDSKGEFVRQRGALRQEIEQREAQGEEVYFWTTIHDESDAWACEGFEGGIREIKFNFPTTK